MEEEYEARADDLEDRGGRREEGGKGGSKREAWEASGEGSGRIVEEEAEILN